MEVNTKVNGGFWEVVKLKFPLSSVKVPMEVPLIVTDTAGTTSAFELFFTFPVTVTVWEKAAIEVNRANSIMAR